MLDNISIIIPIAPDEQEHHQLITSLHGQGNHESVQSRGNEIEIIISSETSRASSLNAGAAKAKSEFLWFLHADSRVNEDVFQALEKAIKDKPNALHYFDLSYEEGGFATLNAVGANIRSRLFSLPYGDQGLCISKMQFEKIGGFPESSLGEDLLFIRIAKRAGIRLNRIPAKLITSARKYKEIGWLKLTILRQWQLFKLLRQKI